MVQLGYVYYVGTCTGGIDAILVVHRNQWIGSHYNSLIFLLHQYEKITQISK